MTSTSCGDGHDDHDGGGQGPATQLDGIVAGTDQADLIDTGYLGDPEGDRIDNGDAVLKGEAPEDDIVTAGAGDDTIFSGLGRDEIYGGSGDDLIDSGEGNDLVFGGSGADVIAGGSGSDWLFGGADPDTFTGISPGDVIFGGSTGIDQDTLNLAGSIPPGGAIRIIYGLNPEDGIVEFYDCNGHRIGSAYFHDIEKIVPCFTPGTLIATPRGEVPVEELQVGDRVITRDNGLQQIRWIGHKTLTRGALMAAPHMAPVRVAAGALGYGLPVSDLVVSPNHRILVTQDRAALYFDDREVLVMAKHLMGLPGVSRETAEEATYIHFMFDQHEIVLSNGAWTESFQPGHQAMDGLDRDTRNELLELFPELSAIEFVERFPAARRSLKRHEAAVLMAAQAQASPT